MFRLERHVREEFVDIPNTCRTTERFEKTLLLELSSCERRGEEVHQVVGTLELLGAGSAKLDKMLPTLRSFSQSRSLVRHLDGMWAPGTFLLLSRCCTQTRPDQAVSLRSHRWGGA